MSDRVIFMVATVVAVIAAFETYYLLSRKTKQKTRQMEAEFAAGTSRTGSALIEDIMKKVQAAEASAAWRLNLAAFILQYVSLELMLEPQHEEKDELFAFARNNPNSLRGSVLEFFQQRVQMEIEPFADTEEEQASLYLDLAKELIRSI